jgi:hypothetical protein
MEHIIKSDDKLRILNEVIEELPIDYIRQIKINYDAKIISIIFLELLKDVNKNNKLIFNDLKYYNYEMQDIYYLISKIANIITANNYKITYFPNYKKDGYNIFINLNIMFSLYMEDDNIIILEYIK